MPGPVLDLKGTVRLVRQLQRYLLHFTQNLGTFMTLARPEQEGCNHPFMHTVPKRQVYKCTTLLTAW